MNSIVIKVATGKLSAKSAPKPFVFKSLKYVDFNLYFSTNEFNGDLDIMKYLEPSIGGMTITGPPLGVWFYV
jgi:hypothetical protein